MSYRPSPRPAASRRPTKRQYQARRALAAVVVLAVLYGGYQVVASVVGGDESPKIEASAPQTSLVESNGSTPITAPPSTSTTSPPRETFVPSAETPVTLYIAGDSDAGAFAPYLQKLMNQTGMVTTNVDYKTSSGLARPDYYDWPAHFNEVIPQINPDIVVVTFGGNDTQGLYSVEAGKFIYGQAKGDDSDAGWREEYGRRVGAVMDYLSAGNRTLIWVGIPNAESESTTTRLRVQNEVVMAEVAKRPKVQFVDTWERFMGRNTGYAPFVIDPRDGQGKNVRRDDGFHLNVTGAEILALDIAEVVRAELRSRGATI